MLFFVFLISLSLSFFFQSPGDPFRQRRERKKKKQDLLQKTFFLTRLGDEKKKGEEKR